MKKIVLVLFLGVSLFFGLSVFFQSEEKRIKKKTLKLIQLVSINTGESDIALLRRLSKVAQFIHHAVELKAEYEGGIYKVKSLGEFKSLLMAYFKEKGTGTLDYEELNVEMFDNNERAEVRFSAVFERKNQFVKCAAFLIWIKDKKWYIKNIEVSSCSYKKP